MDLETGAVIAGLVGLLTAALNYKSKAKDQKRDFFLVVTERLNAQAIELQSKVAALEVEKKELKQENEAIKKQLKEENDKLLLLIAEKDMTIKELNQKILNYQMMVQQLEIGAEYLPFPYWLKDTTGTYIAINKAFEIEILKPYGATKADLIGKTGLSFWGKEVDDLMKEHESKAVKADDKIWVTSNKYNPAFENYKILNFSRFYQNQLIGIGGFAIKESDFNK